MKNNIEFWFSIGSTYTYLSVQRILDVEKEHNVKFIHVLPKIRLGNLKPS